MVSKFARHYKTGEALPANRLESLCAAKHTFAAAEMQQQVFYSALDQKLHVHPLSGSKSTTTEVLAEVQHQYYGLPFVPYTVNVTESKSKHVSTFFFRRHGNTDLVTSWAMGPNTTLTYFLAV